MAAPNAVFELVSDWHVVATAARMRSADRDEVLASGGFSPIEALRGAVSLSEFARTLLVDGEPMAIFGVVNRSENGWAIPWWLSTDLADRYPITFWKASKKVIAWIREAYPLLEQHIDWRHERALRWAKRLGFEIGPPKPFGFSGLPFCRISICSAGAS